MYGKNGWSPIDIGLCFMIILMVTIVATCPLVTRTIN